VQNDDRYRSLHDERSAAKHPHPLTLSWNASYPNDERGGAATLQEQRNQYEKNGGTRLLKQRHRLRSLLLLKDFVAHLFNSFFSVRRDGVASDAASFSSEAMI
jgi:hypothetical protein